LPTYIGTDEPGCSPQLTAAARRAIALDPTLAEPWAVQGLAAGQGEHDQFAARAFSKRRWRSTPTTVTTNFWFGLNLLRSGYRKAASAHRPRARDRPDGAERDALARRGVPARRRLRQRRAVPQARAGLPAWDLRTRAGRAGRAAAAIVPRPTAKWRLGTGVLIPLPAAGDADAIVAGLYGGNAAERARAIAALEDYARNRESVSGLVPLMLAQMGRGAQALDIAHRKVTGDDSDFMVYLFSPAGAPMRALPEYQAFIEAEGFSALWAKYGPPDFERK
jgi:hypothetical protein